jgi:hypothetical protein
MLAGVLLMLVAACTPPFPHPRTTVALGGEFQLPRGQMAAVQGEDFVVRFAGVAEDSRCAANVQCIRAGEARVRIELWKRGHEQEEVILATEPGRPRYASFDSYDIHLVRLDPLPRTDVLHPPYVATLRVVRR